VGGVGWGGVGWLGSIVRALCAITEQPIRIDFGRSIGRFACRGHPRRVLRSGAAVHNCWNHCMTAAAVRTCIGTSSALTGPTPARVG
jgi:hypothetical protein